MESEFYLLIQFSQLSKFCLSSVDHKFVPKFKELQGHIFWVAGQSTPFQSTLYPSTSSILPYVPIYPMPIYPKLNLRQNDNSKIVIAAVVVNCPRVRVEMCRLPVVDSTDIPACLQMAQLQPLIKRGERRLIAAVAPRCCELAIRV